MIMKNLSTTVKNILKEADETMFDATEFYSNTNEALNSISAANESLYANRANSIPPGIAEKYNSVALKCADVQKELSELLAGIASGHI